MQYKEIGQNLEEGMKGLGDQIRSMPHIKIGKETNSSPSEPRKPIFNEKEAEWVDKAKKWGLIFCVLVVVIYALYRILRGFLF